MLREFFRRTFQRWLPNFDGILSGRQIFQHGAPIFAGDLKVRRRQHRHVGDHPVMNSASERDESLLVECDRFGRNTSVKRQLKFFSRRQRVNIMANVVAIRENQRCSPTWIAVTYGTNCLSRWSITACFFSSEATGLFDFA